VQFWKMFNLDSLLTFQFSNALFTDFEVKFINTVPILQFASEGFIYYGYNYVPTNNNIIMTILLVP